MISYTARTSQEQVDPVRIGGYWATIIEDFLRSAVDDHHLLPEAQTIDLTFDDFMADDVAAVERIYALAGQPFTATTRAVRPLRSNAFLRSSILRRMSLFSLGGRYLRAPNLWIS